MHFGFVEGVGKPASLSMQHFLTFDACRGSYLSELCMTTAGVKSCFDGVAFAKVKLEEWQKVSFQ